MLVRPRGDVEEPVVDVGLGPHVEAAVGSSSTRHPGAAPRRRRAPGPGRCAATRHRESSVPPSNWRSSTVSHPSASPAMTTSAPARAAARSSARLVVDVLGSAEADVGPGRQRVAPEVLEDGRHPSLPLRAGPGRARARRPSTMRPAVGLVEPGEQLDERGLARAVHPDDGDRRAGLRPRGRGRRAPRVGAGVAEATASNPIARLGAEPAGRPRRPDRARVRGCAARSPRGAPGHGRRPRPAVLEVADASEPVEPDDGLERDHADR